MSDSAETQQAPEIHTCSTCGFEWKHGENGSHQCAPILKKKLDETESSFDLRWKADQRAIKKWQEATGKATEWPDHADLCVWLLEQLDAEKRITEHWRNYATVLADQVFIPERNCSCHISPPCSDCVNYAHVREAREAVSKIES
jgi:hypothetical protein